LSKRSFKNVARDSNKKIFRPIRAIDFFDTNQVYTLNQGGNIPPHALLQWPSDANVECMYD